MTISIIIIRYNCVYTLYMIKKGNKKSDTQLNLRISNEVKELIDLAAQFSNINRSTFILNSVLETANEIIQENEEYYLEKSDFDAFKKALDSDRSITEKELVCWKNLITMKRVWD